ncbi:HNH endonuclease [Streptomyces asiaticus]|uniref:HNH endonuclease n=1 Tax=Streptomyces asiaticus TaxID=114695 RepID=UPI0037FF39EC
MKPTDVDIDDFFEFVGDFNSKWTDDRRGIVLATAKRRPYRSAAYLVGQSRPSMVITFREAMTDEERSRIYSHIRDSTQKLDSHLSADVRVSWHRRTVRVTRRKPIRWPSDTVNQGTYAQSAAAAKHWYEKARLEVENLIRQAHDSTSATHRSHSSVTRKMISSAPALVPTAKPPRVDAAPPSAWPIPLTPAAPRNSPAAQTAPQPVKEPAPSTPVPATVHEEAAKNSQTPKHRLCPVCTKPVSAGRLRHQRCERRTIPGQTPEPVATPAIPKVNPPDSSEYQRLVRKVEQRETTTYGERRDTTRQDPVRLEEARKAVLLRCQGHCENPTCGGEPNDLTDDGRPILEVDHVQRIAEGGRDHPVQMVALCPNCHAMKERGANRHALQAVLRDVAAGAHRLWICSPS